MAGTGGDDHRARPRPGGDGGSTGPVIGRRLRVRGDVQGVGFRWSCQARAVELGVGGWVRNRDDGSVEVLVVGPPAAVHDLVDWCRQGPRYAAVADMDVTDAQPADLERAGLRFSVLR